MRKILFLVIIVAHAFVAQGKTAKEMFVSMPDTVMPYLTPDTRMVLTSFPDSAIAEKSGFCTFTLSGKKDKGATTLDNIIRLTVSDNITLEIGRLADNRFIIITTYAGPEKESRCLLCDSLWNTVSRLSFDNIDLFTDSATVEQRKMVEFPLIEAHIADDARTLTLSLNTPLLSADDRKSLAPYLRQRKLTWNGQAFK